jgi:hypothetical protein
MYAYCNGNPVMLCDPTGRAAGGWEALGLALRVAAKLFEILNAFFDSSKIEQIFADAEIISFSQMAIDTDGPGGYGKHWQPTTSFGYGLQFLNPFEIRYVVLPKDEYSYST